MYKYAIGSSLVIITYMLENMYIVETNEFKCLNTSLLLNIWLYINSDVSENITGNSKCWSWFI